MDQPAQTPYNSRSITDKFYFAAYLNLARHNAFLVINDICTTIGKATIDNEENLLNSNLFDVLITSTKPQDVVRLTTLLESRFPFIKDMVRTYSRITLATNSLGGPTTNVNPILPAESPQNYYDTFQIIFALLNDYRNAFTHAYQKTPTFDKKYVEKMLDECFDTAMRKVKDEKGWQQSNVEHLTRLTKNTDPRVRFDRTLPKSMVKKDFQYVMVEENSSGQYQLSEKGLAYFICLFLEKKDAFNFLKKISGFKDSRETWAQATLEVYTRHRIRIPRVRLENAPGNETTSLLLDMLNELQRCPSELYPHLSPEDQARFMVSENYPDEDTGLEPETLLLRKSDRFTYFVQRYFDLTNALPTVRFSVDLGNYHFQSYEKTIGGVPMLRRLSKKVTAFGKLESFTNDKKGQDWLSIEKDPKEISENTPAPYITKTTPHYHFATDNIGIFFNPSPDPIPQLDSYPSLEIGKKQRNIQPQLWISRDELMSMTFYHLMQKDSKPGSDNKSVEKILKSYYHTTEAGFKNVIKTPDVHNFATKIDRDEALNKQIFKNRNPELRDKIIQLPKPLLNALLASNDITWHMKAKAKLDEMLQRTERLINAHIKVQDKSNRKNKPGRKGYKPLKPGKMAAFIAQDLLRFQPTIDQIGDTQTGKGKVTGLGYQVLQATFALYGKDKAKLPGLLKEFRLIESSNPHPFIQNTMKRECRGIAEFYSQYLEDRKLYLAKAKQAKNYESMHWLHLNQAKLLQEPDFHVKLAERYLNGPFNFPRGVFSALLKNHLSIPDSPLNQILNKEDRANAVYLLKKLFEKSEDQSQWFYKAKRSYKIFDRLQVKKNSFSKLIPQYYSPEGFQEKLPKLKTWIASLPETNSAKSPERANRTADLVSFKKNEKHIRHLAAQDQVLFLMVKDLIMKVWPDLFQNPSQLNEMKLRAISPDGDQSVLSQFIPASLIIKKGKNPDDIINITQNQLKIKNYGDFRRFVKDRRIPGLLKYLNSEQKNITREILEKELSDYESHRIHIFQVFQEFEMTLFKKYSQELKDILSDVNNDVSEHQKLLNLYAAKTNTDVRNLAPLAAIRNSYSHNELPIFTDFQGQVFLDGQTSVSTFFLNLANVGYKQMTEMIESLEKPNSISS